MAVKFIPIGDRVLVHVIDQQNILEGVLLPDSAREDAQLGLVVAVGDSKLYAEGDKVLFGPWAGKEIQLDGTPFRVLREGEIDGKIVTVQ
jgi:chaperonin GroES